jgi:hypothetical protein
MAFIISKKSSKNGEARKIYYLVENYREDNRIKRKKLLALGEHDNLHDFLEVTITRKVDTANRIIQNQTKLNTFLETGKNPFLFPSTKRKITDTLIHAIERERVSLLACEAMEKKIRSYMC